MSKPLTSALLISSSLLFSFSGHVLAQTGGQFTATGSMTVGRAAHTATLLSSGQVLIAGGYAPDFSTQFSAELFNPATGTFNAVAGSMSAARSNSTATLLPNGKVLLVGGFSNQTSANTSSADLYDPSTGTFAPTGSLNVARAGHTATLLPNGKVLVTGGISNDWVALAGSELYDATTGSFTPTGNMATARQNHTATMLLNGKVLIAGGASYAGIIYGSCELYDPSTGTFASTGSLNVARAGQTATLLLNGKVLIAGGEGNNGGGIADLSTTELYDAATGTFTTAGNMVAGRSSHTAVLTGNGQVLLAGGGTNGVIVSTAELYNPSTATSTATGSMTNVRANHTATLLSNGKVLVAGGRDGSNTALASADLFITTTSSPLYHICVLYDSTKAVNSGGTLPIKLQLCDGSGIDLSSSTIALSATSITQISTSISGQVQASGNADPDNNFRFDSTLGPTGGYIFNLSTKGMATGSYNLNFMVSGDTAAYATPFQVK